MMQGIVHEDKINADKTEVLLNANTASTFPMMIINTDRSWK